MRQSLPNRLHSDLKLAQPQRPKNGQVSACNRTELCDKIAIVSSHMRTRPPLRARLGTLAPQGSSMRR